MLDADPQAANGVSAAARSEGSAAAFLRFHAAGIAVALVLATLLIGPQYALRLTDPPAEERHVLSPFASSDQGIDLALRAPTIRMAYDGKWPLIDYYRGGNDDVSTQTGAIWLELIGWLGHPLGGIFNALLLVTTLAAIAIFLSLYALGYELTRSRLAAVLLMPVVLGVVEVLRFSDGILPLRQRHVISAIVRAYPGPDFLAWLRFLPPIMLVAPFFVAALAVPRAVATGARTWTVVAVVALALLVYSYFYYWSSAALALGAWMAWLLWRRDVVAARRLAVVGALTGVLAAPELITGLRTAFTTSEDFQARLGTTTALAFVPSYREIAARLLVGSPVLIACLRGPERNRLYIALYIAPLLLSRPPVDLPQPFHFADQVWPVFAVPAVLAGGRELWRWLLPRAYERHAFAGIGALALLALAFTSAVQVNAFGITSAGFAMRSDERAAFDWIEDHVRAPETVVSPSMSTNMYVASLTPARRYLQWADVPSLSDDELIDDYLRVSAAYGYAPEDVMERLDPKYFPFAGASEDAWERERELEYSMGFYLLNWQITEPPLIESRIPRWRAEYEALLTSEHPLGGGRRADYLYCGPRERFFEAVSPARGTYVRPAFERGEVTIYELVGRASPGAVEFAGC